MLSDTLQEKVLLGVIGTAGPTGPDQKLPGSVRVKNGIVKFRQTAALTISTIPVPFEPLRPSVQCGKLM